MSCCIVTLSPFTARGRALSAAVWLINSSEWCERHRVEDEGVKNVVGAVTQKAERSNHRLRGRTIKGINAYDANHLL